MRLFTIAQCSPNASPNLHHLRMCKWVWLVRFPVFLTDRGNAPADRRDLVRSRKVGQVKRDGSWKCRKWQNTVRAAPISEVSAVGTLGALRTYRDR